MNKPNIDNIIGNSSLPPYANSQPEHITVPNLQLQRIPPLATPEGVNPEFQKFFDDVVEGVLQFIQNQRAQYLHNVSDNAIPLQDFHHILTNTWGETCTEMNNAGPCDTGIDIELNMDRFKDIHRNLVGGFNILIYCLNVKDDEFDNSNANYQITEFTKASTELLFTYKNDRFQILSRIQSFMKESI